MIKISDLGKLDIEKCLSGLIKIQNMITTNIKNQSRIAIMICLILVFVLTSCGLNQVKQIRDDELGISFEIPTNWDMKETQRFYSLILTPKDNRSEEDSVSITILANSNTELSLITALTNDVERLRELTSSGEIDFIELPRKLSNIEDYDAVIATISMSGDSTNEDNGKATKQSELMDIIVIKGNTNLIMIYVHKSNSDESLNLQIEDILNSIRLSE